MALIRVAVAVWERQWPHFQITRLTAGPDARPRRARYRRDRLSLGAERSDEDRALNAALAEFSSMRALVAARVQLQIAWLTAGFTAIGIILGLALQKGGDPNRIGLSGRYVRDQLWPYITSITDRELHSWEHYTADNASVVLLGISGAQAPGFLLLASVLPLVARFHALDGGSGHVLLWIVGAVLTLVSAAYGVSVGIYELRDAHSARIQHTLEEAA